MSTFFRTHKNPDNPFVMVDKRPVENPDLSWAAKGMLAYLLSRPDNWEVVMQDLINRSTDGEYAVRGIVKELVEAGHIVHREVREKGKFVKHVYDVYEESTISRFPTSGFPTSGEPRPNNTDSTNTESNNTASGENQPSAMPDSFPIEWQIAGGKEEIVVPDNKAAQMMDTAHLITMGIKGVDYHIAYGIAYTFMETRGIIIPQSKVKAQRKAVREMIEMGVLPNHVQEATQKLMKANLTVTDLYSVAKTATDLANPAPDNYGGAIDGV